MAEGIYVGYRYFETFDVPVNFAFGHGLSYTTFDITTDSVTVANGKVEVVATVKNTGDVAGKEVVQVYFGAPDEKMEKIFKKLVAFAKTAGLQLGATQTLTMTYDVERMAAYDESQTAYILEPGAYNIFVGNSVKDVAKAYTYQVAEEVITFQSKNMFEVKYDFKELSKKDESKRPIVYDDPNGCFHCSG